jgi:AcrR family transcriptional regulator
VSIGISNPILTAVKFYAYQSTSNLSRVKLGATFAAVGDHASATPQPQLPVAGAPRPERADAARNRARILAAARTLFEERGVRAVTMSDVARAAGVVKGTVFHRFGDRAGLAAALLDEEERRLQEQILRGPPPVGPGYSPRERLIAFLRALLRLAVDNCDLLLEVDRSAPAGRYRTGAYGAWHRHVVVLLEEIGATANPAVLAHVVLAPLAPDLLWHLDKDEGISVLELDATLIELLGVVSR